MRNQRSGRKIEGLLHDSIRIMWLAQGHKEMVEMSYLTETPVYLDGSKYKKTIGSLIQTSFEVGIAETIRSIQKDTQSAK